MIGLGIGIGVKLGAAVKTLLAAAAVVAVVSVLSWERVRAWFHSREHLATADKDHVAFSVVEKLQSNNYKTVFGIFNERTGKIVEAESVESGALDDTLRSYHENEPLVLYR